MIHYYHGVNKVLDLLRDPTPSVLKAIGDILSGPLHHAHPDVIEHALRTALIKVAAAIEKEI